MSILDKIFGDPNAREVKKLQPLVDRINLLEAEFESLSDEQLRSKTAEFKQRLQQGATLQGLLPEAFAAVREAAKRVLGMRHFDVQLLGGMILHRGEIAEMRTGEGKTLVATLPLYLNALTGLGVHLVTVNDYLARRDTTWMGKIYHALGLSVACVQSQGVSYIYDPSFSPDENTPALKTAITSQSGAKSKVDQQHLREIARQEAYAADITYGTNNEFGFDYLRDNMAQSQAAQVQRGLHYAIVDEVDSILIDEARTPLIISAPAQESTDLYRQFAALVPRLQEGQDYNIDEKLRAATLTEEGIHRVEELLGIENLYAEGGIRQVHHLEQALKAHTLFHRDREYVVRDGEVIIVDEFTGRLMYGRRYSEGLHQAIEAKEGVRVQQESVTMATITFQNLFRLYGKLAGMTGTAKTEEEEFAKIYGLPVVMIPTNKPVTRRDHQDRIYKNENGKLDAVVEEIKTKNELGQPVLVGTVSIEKNEQLSALLKKAGIEHAVLNAKDHEREALVIAQAGRPGAVTVATNMAGRGVDIILGGDPPDGALADTVKKLGGLHVLGTERHESRRIDNQLRGRAGRQGDHGSSVFFISTDDDLMRIFGSSRMKTVMERLGVPDDMPIENKLISKSIEAAQKKVEGHNFDIRKRLVDYDDVINKHREVIYKMRQDILQDGTNRTVVKGSDSSKIQDGLSDATDTASLPAAATAEVKQERGETGGFSELASRILKLVAEEIEQVVSFHTRSDQQSNWNWDEIYETIDTVFPVPLEVRLKMQDIEEKIQQQTDALGEPSSLAGGKHAHKASGAVKLKGREALIEYLTGLSRQVYAEWEKKLIEHEQNKIGADLVRQLERTLLLRSIDTIWVEHLDAMDHLRTGIGLRGYGQRDPLIEYKREAFKMFDKLKASIRQQVVYSIFKIGRPLREEARTENLRYAGAIKTQESGQGQFASLSTTRLASSGAVSGTMRTPTGTVGPRPAERLARKKAGVKDEPVRLEKKVGRNEPCPCGSGKKYKKCHGA